MVSHMLGRCSYHLSHSASPFFVTGVFEIGSLELFPWVWIQTTILLIAASWVVRITGVSHRCPLQILYFLIIPDLGNPETIFINECDLHLSQNFCLFPLNHSGNQSFWFPYPQRTSFCFHGFFSIVLLLLISLISGLYHFFPCAWFEFNLLLS
jgi:hypothetical protein